MNRDQAILRFLDHLLAEYSSQGTFEAEMLDASFVDQIVEEAEQRGCKIERNPFKVCRLVFHCQSQHAPVARA